MRKWGFLLVMVLMLSLGNRVQAQNPPPVYCGDLSVLDCGLLRDSAAAMADLESAAFHYDLTFKISNLPDAYSFRLNGSGAYRLDLARLAELEALPDELAANPALLPQYFETLLKAISLDTTMIVHLPDNLGMPLPDKVSFDVRLVDGFAYLNLSKLAALDTSNTLPRGWLGFDLAGYYRVFFEQQNPLNTVPNLSPNNILTDPAFGDSYITLDRLEDTQSHGQTAAVFEAVTDFETLFTNPQIEDDLWEVLQPQAEIMGLSGNKRELLDAYAAVMQGFVVNTHEIIGRDDFYVHGLTLTLDWSPDLGTFDRAMGGSGDYLPLVNIALMLQVQLDQFNAVSPITAPPGAMIIPLDGIVPARPTA